MKFTPQAKLLTFIYAIIAVTLADKWIDGHLRGGEGWLYLACYFCAILLAPFLVRLFQMFRWWGWAAAIVAVVLAALAPVNIAHGVPWALYLSNIFVLIFGAYVCLFDRSVRQYASELRTKTESRRLA